MSFLESVIKSLRLSFIWKGNTKKNTVQKNAEIQVSQEQGTTNIFNIENLTVNEIREFAGSDISDPQAVLQSAGRRFLTEQVYRQQNLSRTVELASLDSIADPKQTDKDWFLKWAHSAEEVSREDMRGILAKILAGEISRPNSFSARTIEVVRNLSQGELELFRKFCEISYSLDLSKLKIEGGDPEKVQDKTITVITSPFGSAGNNALKAFGLGYNELGILQEAGLVRNDLTSWREHNQEFFQIPFKLGSEAIQLRLIEKTNPDPMKRISVVNFSEAGWELRSVMEFGSNADYISKFLEWANNVFKVTI